MNASSDPLDRLLHRSSPVPQHQLDTAEVQRAMAAALAAARREADRDQLSSDDPTAGVSCLPTRWRRPHVVGKAVLVTAVVVAAGTGVAAAGGFLPLGTGVFGSPGMTENDTSELLNSTSPETAVLLQQYVDQMTMAPGYTARSAIEQFTTGENVIVQDAGLQGRAFAWSSCSWELSWLDAHEAGDLAAQDAATRVLTQIPSWTVVPLIDGDGGLTRTVQVIADAAAAGQPGPIQRDADVNCDREYLR